MAVAGAGKSDSFWFKAGRLRPVLRCAIYCLAVFVAALAASTFVRVALSADFAGLPSTTMNYWSIAVTNAAVYAAVIGGAFALRRWLDRRSVASLGYPLRRRAPLLFALGAAFGAGTQLIVFLLELVPGYAHVLGNGSLHGIALEAAIGIPIFLIAAFAEEIAFRGYLFQNLWEEWGVWPAAVVTAILFAVLHVNNPNFNANALQSFAGLVLFGVFAALSVVWTRSAWLVFGMHTAWNYFEGPVLGFPVSGIDIPGTSVLATLVTGPDWYTGGAFGPEAGVTETIAIGVALLALWWLHRRGAFADAPDAREPYAK